MFEAEVRAGAMELDMTYPGWDRRIELERLSLSSCTECVLGQTFGWYTMGVLRLLDAPVQLDEAGMPYLTGEQWSWADRHGFAVGSTKRWAELRDAWIALIEERRASRLAESEAPEPVAELVSV